MPHPLPTRVVERLRRLREKFGERVREHQVDHDHDHLTSTRREHVARRKFYLGEIWWTQRVALGDHRPHREGASHLPALVTRQQEIAGEPVDVAPPCPRHLSGAEAAKLDCFQAKPREGLEAGAGFLLALRRPVPRHAFGRPAATLSGLEKQSLVVALQGGIGHA